MKSEIAKIAVSCLKLNISPGYDDVKPEIVKKVIPFIVKPHCKCYFMISILGMGERVRWKWKMLNI